MSDVTLIRLDSRGFIICEFVAGASVLGSLKGQRRLIPQDKASTQGVTDTVFYTSLIGIEALAGYTYSLEGKYDRTERTKRLFIAWNVFFGVLAAADWLPSNEEEKIAEKEDVALSFLPLHDGGFLNISLNF